MRSSHVVEQEAGTLRSMMSKPRLSGSPWILGRPSRDQILERPVYKARTARRNPPCISAQDFHCPLPSCINVAL